MSYIVGKNTIASLSNIRSIERPDTHVLLITYESERTHFGMSGPDRIRVEFETDGEADSIFAQLASMFKPKIVPKQEPSK